MINVGSLGNNEKYQALVIFKIYSDVMASNNNDLTCADVKPFEINTGESKPVKGSLYQTLPVFDEFVKKEIDTLLKDGLIRESNSP